MGGRGAARDRTYYRDRHGKMTKTDRLLVERVKRIWKEHCENEKT